MYIFGCDGDEEVYIASADLMTRNTTRRVEVAVPIFDASLRARLLDDFRRMLSDTCKLRVQLDDGSYVKVRSEERRFNVQEYFAENSYRRAGLPLPEETGAPTGKENPAPDTIPPLEAPAKASADDAVPELSTQQPDEKPDPVPVTVPVPVVSHAEAESVSANMSPFTANYFRKTAKAIGRRIVVLLKR